ncbi:MAG: hypothetical protein K0Q52_1900 [Microbacterium sp.]|nr:hypothetical protein [Microbacterium sp.]
MPEPVALTWQEYADVAVALSGAVGFLLAVVLGMAFTRMVWS